MPESGTLVDRIGAELAAHSSMDLESLPGLDGEGLVRPVLEELFFFTTPSRFLERSYRLLEQIGSAFSTSDDDRQRGMLRFAAELAIWSASFLPEWHLRSAQNREEEVVAEEDLETLAGRARALASELAGFREAPATRLLASWRREVGARLAAEGVTDPHGAAALLVGDNVEHYLSNVILAVGKSNVRRVAEMHARGETRTEISNDYAAFLDYAMLVGASFVTCNPPLVDLAWVGDKERWDPIVDQIVQANPGSDSTVLATKITLEIVLANMRLLRPIFLLTEGRTGYVSLQVNPRNHSDTSAMVSEAEGIYSDLEKRLAGGVPNVVFKLPATHAGLVACRTLTGEGIGVNITVSFGMFQHIEFAGAIREGKALVSTITHMSGRLAFPIRDELLGKLDLLKRNNINETDARMAAAWSGVAILKRLQDWMTRRGYDFAQVKPLVASLRVYDGEAYAGMPTAVPDISEVIGTGIITVFPNVRHAFDALPPMDLKPRQVDVPVPERMLEILEQSEIFKQAFHEESAKRRDIEEEQLRPDHVLRLDDEAAVAEWLPVKNTIAEFCRAYDAFVRRIEDRVVATSR
jgi:hypothetical protein